MCVFTMQLQLSTPMHVIKKNFPFENSLLLSLSTKSFKLAFNLFNAKLQARLELNIQFLLKTSHGKGSFERVQVSAPKIVPQLRRLCKFNNGFSKSSSRVKGAD